MLVGTQACQHPTQHDLAASHDAGHHVSGRASAGNILPRSLSSSHAGGSLQNTCTVQDRADAASAAAEEAITDAYLHPYTQLLLDGPVPQYVRMQQPASEEQQREQLGGRFSGEWGCPKHCSVACCPSPSCSDPAGGHSHPVGPEQGISGLQSGTAFSLWFRVPQSNAGWTLQMLLAPGFSPGDHVLASSSAMQCCA